MKLRRIKTLVVTAFLAASFQDTISAQCSTYYLTCPTFDMGSCFPCGPQSYGVWEDFYASWSWHGSCLYCYTGCSYFDMCQLTRFFGGHRCSGSEEYQQFETYICCNYCY